VLRIDLPRRLARTSLPALLEVLASGPVEPAPLEAIEEALDCADKLAGFMPFVPSTCLYRSLARYALLRRAGYAARFVMGLGSAVDLEGHAWVELDGAPWGEEVDAGLVVTYAYPESR